MVKKYREFINDFTTISFASEYSANYYVGIEDNINSVTIYNQAIFTAIIVNSGVGLTIGESFVITGKEGEHLKGKIYLTVRDFLPGVTGKALLIKKRFI